MPDLTITITNEQALRAKTALEAHLSTNNMEETHLTNEEFITKVQEYMKQKIKLLTLKQERKIAVKTACETIQEF